MKSNPHKSVYLPACLLMILVVLLLWLFEIEMRALWNLLCWIPLWMLPADLKSTLMARHTETYFPIFGSGKWPPSLTDAPCIGSHIGHMGKCIHVAKASPSYFSSVSSTAYVFLLLILIYTWIFGKFETVSSWVILSLIDQLLCRSQVGGRLQGKGPAGKSGQQSLITAPPVMADRWRKKCNLFFLTVVWEHHLPVAQSKIREYSKQEASLANCSSSPLLTAESWLRAETWHSLL